MHTNLKERLNNKIILSIDVYYILHSGLKKSFSPLIGTYLILRLDLPKIVFIDEEQHTM